MTFHPDIKFKHTLIFSTKASESKSPCVTHHGLSICYLLLLCSRKSCSDLQHATKNWAWWFCDKWGNLYSHPSPCSHPPSLSAGWPLPSRCVTELLSCHTGGINYRTRSSWCHCSVINGLSRRCAMGPGLTVNSTGIQRQTHTHTHTLTHTCWNLDVAFESLAHTCLKEFSDVLLNPTWKSSVWYISP